MATIDENLQTSPRLPMSPDASYVKTATQDDWNMILPSPDFLSLLQPDQVQSKSKTKTKPNKTKNKRPPKQDPLDDLLSIFPPANMVSNIDASLDTEEISSATAILPRTGASDSLVDKSCYLSPWKRNTYITYCATTPVDFRRYLWLLKCGQPERWYQEPPETLKKALVDNRDTTASYILSPFNEAIPCALECPRICVTRALAPAPGAGAQHAGLTSTSNEPANLCYLSVVQAPHRHREFSMSTARRSYDSFDGSSTHVATPIFKLVINGSHNSALTQAFYDAGAHGWSTVFTCMVLDRGFTENGAAGLSPESLRAGSLTDFLTPCREERTASMVLY